MHSAYYITSLFPPKTMSDFHKYLKSFTISGYLSSMNNQKNEKLVMIPSMIDKYVYMHIFRHIIALYTAMALVHDSAMQKLWHLQK